MIASTIIQSSILVLAILLIRKIFKERISAQMLYRLWGLVVLRLLWPVVALYGHIIGLNLPKSEISIMNIFEAVKDGVLSTHPAAYFVIDNITLGHVYTSDTGLVGLGLAGFMAEEQGIGANFGWIQNLAASKMPFLAGLDLQLLFGIIWIVGAVCVCMWFHHINSKFINRLVDDRNELILDAETIDEISGIISDKIKLSQRSVIKLYSVDNLSTPCIVSIKGEVGIYIPTKIVSDKRKLTYALTV